MAGDTQTTNYQWIMPEIGGSPTTWGVSLNQDLQDIDSQVFIASQGIAPIGSILMFAGVGPPPNWALCDGSSKSKATGSIYLPLFNVIGYKFGGTGDNFLLPNLQGRFALGVSTIFALGALGGEEKHALTTAELASHSHPITDKTHVHTVNNVMTTASGGHLATGVSGQNLATVTTNPTLTGINTTNAAGSGTPHQNMPPYLVLSFIIRYQ